MNKISKLSIFGLILFFGCLILANTVLGQDTTVTYVDNDKEPAWYDSNHVKTIQEGIDNITTTGIVNIWDSIYFIENISINKPVSLVGNGTTTTILEWSDTSEGTDFQSIMFIESDYINISGLHFNNSAPTQTHRNQILNNGFNTGNYTNIFDCLFTNGTANSLFLSPDENTGVHNINISNNEFYDTHSNIEILYYDNVSIYNNVMNNTETGVRLDASCSYGEISYNTITNTTGGGQLVLLSSDNLLVHHNIIRFGAWTGIAFDDLSHNCTIYSNTIIGFNETSCYGMELYETVDLLIYDNYFLNDNNVYDATGSNTWSITKTLGTNIIGGEYLGGNYWSDYTGEDNTGDGLGDTELPYNNSGEIVTGGDYLPLTGTSTQSIKLRENPELNTVEQAIVGVIGIIILIGFLYIVMKTDYKKEGTLAKLFVGLMIALALLTVIFNVL